GAPALWAMGYTGEGVVVASMDSGVDVTHPDLTASWRGGANSWFDAFDTTTTVPRDGDGHGTATMSLIVGGNAGGTYIGVAPGARWIAAKVFDDNRQATTTTLHEGFQWLLDPDGDPDTHDAPDMVNNSWVIERVDQCDTEFEADIQALRSLGVAVVFSAGNYGPGIATSVSPANYNDSFSVGAVDDSLVVPNFSSRGPSACSGQVYPDVVAPGTSNGPLTFGVKTAYKFGTYLYQEGTSFAAPHVAGAMALLIDAYPTAPVHKVEAAIRRGALDLGAAGPDDDSGHGMLDIVVAFEELFQTQGGPDSDGDGVPDTNDNCIEVANPDQLDTNGDGYGNRCDTDLNNDGMTDFDDFDIFRSVFGSSDPDADFNGDGLVNTRDFLIFRAFFNKPPGPSGLVP
nr:S8 family serine peptidase [Desulfosarcinaceae bacterium]